MAGNSNFDTFVTSTLRSYSTTIEESVLENQALFVQLDARKLVTEKSGGRSIVEPIMYAANDTIRSYDRGDRIPLTYQGGITAAEYDWKFYAGSVSILGTEAFKNGGSKEQIFDLVDAKIQQVELGFIETLSADLYGDGTANDGKVLTGLGVAVEDGTAWSSYGGIDSNAAGNAWWQNQFLNFTTFSSGNNFGDTFGTSTYGIASMRRLWTNCTFGREHPTLIITDSDTFEAYEANIEGDKLRVTDTKLGDAGFDMLSFKGCPIIHDSDMDAGEMLMLNANKMRFVRGKGRNMVSTGFQRSDDQDAKASLTLFAGNLTLQSRRHQGRMTAITLV